jgi:hypothetical protein
MLEGPPRAVLFVNMAGGVMDSNQEMWTPLEAALAPFKELARLNRQSVTDGQGNGVQIVLKADRCHVRLPSGTDADGATIEMGFTLGAEPFTVHFVGSDYRRAGAWDLDRIRTDISTGLQSGALKPGVAWRLGSSR